MSDPVDITDVIESADSEAPTELSIEIKISNQNLSYRSDLAEGETVFWLEAVKNLIIKNTFEKANLSLDS